MDQDFFAKNGLSVSRETIEKLNIYNNLVIKWQKAINLVAPSTLKESAERHFLDSAQLYPWVAGQSIIDLGSGAGFPGLVLAMMGVNVTLVESDQRKAIFLHEVSRETKTPVIIHACRIEDVRETAAEVVTARALAPLNDLLAHMRHLKITRGVFLKGEQAQSEINTAKSNYDFDYKAQNSLTDAKSSLIKITARFT